VPLFPVVALAAARGATREWTNGALPRRILWFTAISAAVLIAGKGIAGQLPRLLESIHRADPVVAGIHLADKVPREVKRDMSEVYRICRPYDEPNRTCFLLYSADRCFGFQFYAASPVIRVASRPQEALPSAVSLEAEPPVRSIAEVLREVGETRGMRPELIVVCREPSLLRLEQELKEHGWHWQKLAQTVFWAVGRATPAAAAADVPDTAPAGPP